MESRENGRAIKAAMSPHFGWKEIAALAFYGTKAELEAYLKKTCVTRAAKRAVAIQTQIPSLNTLIGENRTAYGFVNARTGFTGLLSNIFFVFETNTVSKAEYMQLLIEHVGLFAIREYIRSKIHSLGLDHKDCQMRINIFSRMLAALDDKAYGEIEKIAKNTPSGMICSSEFYDLVTTFAALSRKEMEYQFTEYKEYIVLDMDNDDLMRNLDKACIVNMSFNKAKYMMMGYKNNPASFFAQLPLDVNKIILENLHSLGRQEACAKDPDEIKVTNY